MMLFPAGSETDPDRMGKLFDVLSPGKGLMMKSSGCVAASRRQDPAKVQNLILSRVFPDLSGEGG